MPACQLHRQWIVIQRRMGHLWISLILEVDQWEMEPLRMLRATKRTVRGGQALPSVTQFVYMSGWTSSNKPLFTSIFTPQSALAIRLDVHQVDVGHLAVRGVH